MNSSYSVFHNLHPLAETGSRQQIGCVKLSTCYITACDLNIHIQQKVAKNNISKISTFKDKNILIKFYKIKCEMMNGGVKNRSLSNIST